MAGLTDAIASKILPLVSGVAPLLGAALGSPLGGAALELLAKHFAVPVSDVSALQSAISGDPQSALKLKSLELENAEALARIAASKYQATLQDKQDARKYQEGNEPFLHWMAFFVTVGFFGALFIVLMPWDISAEEKNLLSILVGMLASKWQTIIDFYYGSSN